MILKTASWRFDATFIAYRNYVGTPNYTRLLAHGNDEVPMTLIFLCIKKLFQNPKERYGVFCSLTS